MFDFYPAEVGKTFDQSIMHMNLAKEAGGETKARGYSWLDVAGEIAWHGCNVSQVISPTW